jgi:hypothetical protein
MPNDWNSYKSDFDRTLTQLPPDRDSIKSAAESFGRHVSQKYQQANMPAEEIVNSFRSGLTSTPQGVGTGQPGQTGSDRR